jgi:hypothetical protein
MPDVEKIARSAYAVIQAYNRGTESRFEPPWEALSFDLKKSYVEGVQMVLDNPDAAPDTQHESWLATRRAAGWVWGAVKDVHNKTHPSLLEYSQLPPATRAKDHIFIAVVRAFQELDEDKTAPAPAPTTEGHDDVQPLAHE